MGVVECMRDTEMETLRRFAQVSQCREVKGNSKRGETAVQRQGGMADGIREVICTIS